MIAKNEEDWIAQAIQSVQSILHETILVDTGSTDKTKEIAASLGVKIIEEPWEDDFAKHRNTSIQAATGDWILVLDADEAIVESQVEDLYALTADRTRCIEFLQRHYTNDHRLSDFKPCKGEFPKWEKGQAGYFESNCVRLFPHHEGLYYQGRVHELVEHSIYALNKHRVERTNIRIHHYGHSEKVRAKKNKGSIYTPLGVQKTVEEKDNWKAYFELGVECNVNGRREESVQAFNKAIKLNPTYVDSWLNRGYAQMELGAYKEAVSDFQEALKLQPSNPEAWCNIGVVGMRTNDLGLAERACLNALALREHYVNVWLNLGRTYCMAGRFSQAVLVLKRALEYVPNCVAALADIGAIYLQVGDFKTAETYLLEAHEMTPRDIRLLFNLTQLYKLSKRDGEMRETLQKLKALQAEGIEIELPAEVRELIAGI